MHSVILSSRFEIASFGEIVSDPSRVAMLLSLMDGQARPASELARIAGVTPPTASAHLGRLLRGGFVLAEPRGRHRYFRIAGDHVADALEAIALGVSPRAAPHTRPISSEPSRAHFARARTCYKHLAGALGVAWLAALEARHCLRIEGGAVTLAPRGVACVEELGLTAAAWPPGKPCLDWTERKNHLGGRLGVLLTEQLLAVGWLRRRKEGRALRITTKGRSGFARLGLEDSVLDG